MVYTTIAVVYPDRRILIGLFDPNGVSATSNVWDIEVFPTNTMS